MPFPAPIKVGSSPTCGGNGLFASAPIKAGDVIWRFEGPGSILSDLTGEAAKNRSWTQKELERLGEEDKERLKKILWQGYLHEPTGLFIELVDGGQFTNHSEDPNCGGGWAPTPDGETSIAIRDIAAGEEITDDYGVFQEMSLPWLKDLFAKYCPERHDFEEQFVEKKPKGYISVAERESIHLKIIGYGSVGKAVLCQLRAAERNGTLAPITSVAVFAPEITERRVEGIFSFHHCPLVTRETLIPVINDLDARPGDILVDLSTRIDTATIWAEAKRRGIHFINSCFDVWADQELDLTGLDELRKHPNFTSGKGPTSVFSMGMNPGIVNHFVSHGLKVTTGLSDPSAAAAEFGLKAIIFSERDTQCPRAGSPAERLLIETQQKVLYCSWSPTNFYVETAESTLLAPGLPKEAEEINASHPTFVSWVPGGPIVGFSPPHDETFTVQRWFDRKIPSIFVYEAPPSARFYIKGGNHEPSAQLAWELLTPAAHDLRDESYDMIGCILLSNKGREPFWCGLNMTVSEAACMDGTGFSGPTPLQVMGGVWTALQFVLQNRCTGDCFPEDIPTDFVISTAFPLAGRLSVRPCPEALNVIGFFDPSSPEVLASIRAASPDPARLRRAPSSVHGQGLFATTQLPPSCSLVQLSLSGPVLGAEGFMVNHSCDPNAYVDRNRTVRTLRAVNVDEELTVDYAMVSVRNCPEVRKFGDMSLCCCGAKKCRGSVGDWSSLKASELLGYLKTIPILSEVENDLSEAFSGLRSTTAC